MEASSCKLNDAPEEMELVMYLKERQEEHGSVDGAQISASPRHTLPLSSAVATQISTGEGYLEQIQVGSFYEIDHSKLSSATPEQLKAIRIVMVSEKDEANVSMRYPDVYSLRTHFRNGENVNGQKLPGLNQKYIMSSNIAGEVLSRRIAATEIADRRDSWNFWTALPEVAERDHLRPVSGGGAINAVSKKKGVCWSELKFTGMVQWGSRRQVQYIGRHEDKKLLTLSKFVDNEDAKKVESLGEDEKKTDSEDGEELFRVANTYDEQKNLRRKRHCSRNGQKKRKIAIPERKNGAQLRSTGRKKELKKSIDRWSVERYKLAEENMLKIMKAKGAVFGCPILRPALRAEARKLIGDTGLLDHLLKHMAGKVAPGGGERFRRRHNADGAMEYWLESADLINIRKEAGVQDPYWTPPPGWKLGDNPSQDPICSREIKVLHHEIAQIKKFMQELSSTKQQHLTVWTPPNSDITTLSLDHEKVSLIALKETYNELLNRKAKIEEQLLEISQSLRGMEELAGSIVEIQAKEDERMLEAEAGLRKMMVCPQQVTSILSEAEEEERVKRGKLEEKAARIERLKSGFRICKPQGTFLWPNSHGHVGHNVLVPTPPSASSTTTTTTTTPPPLFPSSAPPPSSPLKPQPRRARPHPQGSSSSSYIMINLNEVPDHDHLLFSEPTLTYQRRNPNLTSYPDLPRLVCVEKEIKEKEKEKEKEGSVGSSGGWWLDLPTSSNSSVPE